MNKPCKEWNKAKDKDGYGLTTVMGTQYRVHIREWTKNYGSTKGKIVRHKCDNPSCYEITHLELGTHSQNRQDSFDRGRNSQLGSRNAGAKLTEDDVVQIKIMLKKGNHNGRQIGDMFGVSHKHINQIKLGNRWSHVKINGDDFDD